VSRSSGAVVEETSESAVAALDLLPRRDLTGATAAAKADEANFKILLIETK
jgi:hypothetical protein